MKISEIVREMTPPRYTTSQVAQLIGRHEDTVKRWRDDGVFVPDRANARLFGNTLVWLYTHEDVVALKRLARDRKPGRNRQPA